jgi:hypothetical protein
MSTYYLFIYMAFNIFQAATLEKNLAEAILKKSQVAPYKNLGYPSNQFSGCRLNKQLFFHRYFMPGR